jgi:hypothetical protein
MQRDARIHIQERVRTRLLMKRSFVKNENDTLKVAMSWIFHNYEQEFAECEDFRDLYGTLGLKTLAAEAEAFYYSIAH